MTTTQISVCIPTHRRPRQLARVIEDLAQQTRPPFEVVIVDNTPEGGARPVVDRAIAAGLPFPVRYRIEGRQNISIARNACVDAASGEWIAFIDDDERAPPQWLERLGDAALDHRADVVLAPVVPVLPDTAPKWIRHGRFYEWPRLPTGSPVARNRMRFGNVLLRAALLKSMAWPFDPARGLTGGEDGALLSTLDARGARIIWCDEAEVTEPVERSRLSLGWLTMRALRGGQDFALHTLQGLYGPGPRSRRQFLFLRALVQMTIAVVLVPPTLLLGRHYAAYWTIKAAANLGKLSAFFGWRYAEYARVSVS